MSSETAGTPDSIEPHKRIEQNVSGFSPSFSWEVFPKLAGAITIGFYVIGLLAANSYLYHLGVSSFELLRARFIYTGALVVMPIFASYVCLFHGFRGLRITFFPATPIPSGVKVMNHWFDSLQFCLFLLAVPLAIFAVLTGLRPGGITLRNVWHPLFYYALGATIGGLIHSVGRIGSSKTDPNPDLETARWFIFVFLATFAVAVTIFYISSFASGIYPNVPEQFGGGKPRNVQVLVDSGALQGLKEVGLKSCNDGQMSDTVTVLFEGENSFVLRQKDGPVVQIDRNMIRAVSVTSEGCRR